MRFKLPIMFLTLIPFHAGHILAQDTQSPAIQSEAELPAPHEMKMPQEILEEITVRGDQTFISIRRQIQRAEDNMYSLFNELNSNDDFDIFCRKRWRGSHIARRECEPMFLTRARRANAVLALQSLRDSFSATDGFFGAAGDFSAANGSPMFQYGLDLIMSESELAEGELTGFEALQAEMLRIATENPEYLEALMRVGKMKQQLSDQRMEKFGIP